MTKEQLQFVTKVATSNILYLLTNPNPDDKRLMDDQAIDKAFIHFEEVRKLFPEVEITVTDEDRKTVKEMLNKRFKIGKAL